MLSEMVATMRKNRQNPRTNSMRSRALTPLAVSIATADPSADAILGTPQDLQSWADPRLPLRTRQRLVEFMVFGRTLPWLAEGALRSTARLHQGGAIPKLGQSHTTNKSTVWQAYMSQISWQDIAPAEKQNTRLMRLSPDNWSSADVTQIRCSHRS